MALAAFLKDLSQFLCTELSEDVLLGRNYFLCEKGKVLKYNKDIQLKDFPDLEDPKLQIYVDGCPVDDEQASSITVMDYIASSLYEEGRWYDKELKEGEPRYTTRSWYKCIPMNPEFMQGESYVIIQLYLDKESRIYYFRIWMRQVGSCCQLFSMPGDMGSMESNYRELSFFPPEVVQEIDRLCRGKFLPKDYSFIGKKVTSKMRKNLQLDCANKNEYFYYKESSFTDISNTIIITVDDKESNTITGIETVTNVTERVIMRPVEADTDKLDVLDCLTMMYDYIDEK